MMSMAVVAAVEHTTQRAVDGSTRQKADLLASDGVDEG
jgi:hypothetical protein